jgi:hypothetical protein
MDKKHKRERGKKTEQLRDLEPKKNPVAGAKSIRKAGGGTTGGSGSSY